MINVLSLCDGMSCGQIALKELGAEVGIYYASEIDKNAIKVTQDNFPATIQLGDVRTITRETIEAMPRIDLVMFGSPCQSLSKANINRPNYNNGLKGRSSIFYSCNFVLDMVKLYNNDKVKFLVENVESNKKDDIDRMTAILGVEPIAINSAMFSAQERKRLYWTNIEVGEAPTACNDVLADVLDNNVSEKYYFKEDVHFLPDETSKRLVGRLSLKGHDIIRRVYSTETKSPTLTACRGGNHQVKILDDGRPRKLTPHEYRRLQTVPDWYKMNVADGHIYNMCGDGWTVEVIKWILGGMIK